tara:strand:+ start:213 stop:749 length:537 start_codon:yes stop_codon:yes gene_type:complete
MATGNFYNENASRIFASACEDEFDYEDLIDNVEYAIKELGKLSWSSGKAGKYIDNSSKILEYSLSDSFAYADGTSIECVIHPVVRSGYYSGVNLDWICEYYIDGHEVESDDCIKEHLTWYEGYTELKALKTSVTRFKRLDKIKEKLTDKLEKIYRDYTTPLVVTARFSNGETMYAEAK